MTETKNPNDQPQNWPTSRLLAFATMTLTIATISIFVITAVILNVFQPNLGDESLLLPLMGALLISGTGIAILGMVSGMIDLMESPGCERMTFASLIVNGLAIAFVFSVTVLGMINS